MACSVLWELEERWWERQFERSWHFLSTTYSISKVEKWYLPCFISSLPSPSSPAIPSNNMIQMQSRCLSHQASIFHYRCINLIKCVTDPCSITSHRILENQCLQLTTASFETDITSQIYVAHKWMKRGWKSKNKIVCMYLILWIWRQDCLSFKYSFSL